MRIIDRIILIVFSFFLLAASLITFFMALGWTIPLDYLNQVFSSVNNRWIIGVCSVAVFILGIALLFGNAASRPVVQTKVVMTDHGEISITLPAVEALVKKAAFQIIGVREVRPLIKVTPGGIAVLIKTVMMPGTVIPESAQQLQTTVKSFLEQTAGIDVLEVKVLITEVSQENKGRLK